MTILTVTSAGTMANLKARIADELSRTDLTSQIALAISDAIGIAAAHRFWFNEVRGLTLGLNPNQAYYFNADIDALTEIDTLYILLNTNQRFNLRCVPNARLDALYAGTAAVGQPTIFSRYGSEVRLWPTPGTYYTAYLDGVTRGPVLGDDTMSSIWTTYGEKYVRALAKMLIYAEIIRDDASAERQGKLAESYKQELLNHTEGRLMTGEMEAFGV